MSDGIEGSEQSRKNSFDNFILCSGARIVKNKDKVVVDDVFNELWGDYFLNPDHIAQFFGESFASAQVQQGFEERQVFKDTKLEKPKSLLFATNESVRIQQNNRSDSTEQVLDEHSNTQIGKLVLLSNESPTNQVEEKKNESIGRFYRGTAQTLLASKIKLEKQKVKSKKQEPKELSKTPKSVARFFK